MVSHHGSLTPPLNLCWVILGDLLNNQWVLLFTPLATLWYQVLVLFAVMVWVCVDLDGWKSHHSLTSVKFYHSIVSDLELMIKACWSAEWPKKLKELMSVMSHKEISLWEKLSMFKSTLSRKTLKQVKYREGFTWPLPLSFIAVILESLHYLPRSSPAAPITSRPTTSHAHQPSPVAPITLHPHHPPPAVTPSPTQPTPPVRSLQSNYFFFFQGEIRFQKNPESTQVNVAVKKSDPATFSCEVWGQLPYTIDWYWATEPNGPFLPIDPSGSDERLQDRIGQTVIIPFSSQSSPRVSAYNIRVILWTLGLAVNQLCTNSPVWPQLPPMIPPLWLEQRVPSPLPSHSWFVLWKTMWHLPVAILLIRWQSYQS